MSTTEKKVARTVGVAFLSYFIFIITGCTTYQPPNLPPNKLAHVEEFLIDGNTYLDVTKINDQSTNPYRPFSFTGWGTDVFAIEPGPCTLDLYYKTAMGYANGEVSFNAQAGHSYVIQIKSQVTGKWFKAEWLHFSVIDKRDIKKKKPNEL